MAPTLSILTVTFQAEKTLPLTLQSTAAQTWRDWEHIFVDGRSTDKTLSLIQAYAEKGVPVRWISEKDHGIYDAMNKALQMATGKYVVFLNAGDAFFGPDTLEKLFVHAPPEADVLYGDHVYVSEDGALLPRRRPRPYPHHTLTAKHFRTGMAICHQALFVRREIAPLYTLEFPLAADLDWAIRVLKQAKHPYDSRQILIRYLAGGVSARRLRRYVWERTQILLKHFGPIAVGESLIAALQNLLRNGYPPVQPI
ncbi:MAG: glycosyltransferase [Bacteroidia bacterium]|jgi:glycosyltransferase involved in cell wall biosynthesis|nr:glycosyltransferase [Bacteroidia bacterium]GIV23708.1 MAG: glycosyl transferase [Bacteroidia bacterium]